MKKSLIALLASAASFLLSGTLFVHAAETYSDHEAFCQQAKFSACDTKLSTAIANAKPYSQHWFKLVSYQLDYFYDHQLFHRTLAVTKPLLKRQRLPEVFKAQLYYYHAKSLYYTGDKQQAKEYAFKTQDLLRRHFDAFQDPHRIVEVANLYQVFGEADSAIRLLLDAEKRFAQREDPHFNFELYGNLAQSYIRTNELNKQYHAWQQSIVWAKKTQDPHKVKVAYGGLAYSQKHLHDYQGAYESYQSALAVKQPTPDKTSFVRLQLHLTDMSLKLNKRARAQQHFNQVDFDYVQEHIKPFYFELKQALSLQ